jgi:hypothetical protein
MAFTRSMTLIHTTLSDQKIDLDIIQYKEMSDVDDSGTLDLKYVFLTME